MDMVPLPFEYASVLKCVCVTRPINTDRISSFLVNQAPGQLPGVRIESAPHGPTTGTIGAQLNTARDARELPATENPAEERCLALRGRLGLPRQVLVRFLIEGHLAYRGAEVVGGPLVLAQATGRAIGDHLHLANRVYRCRHV